MTCLLFLSMLIICRGEDFFLGTSLVIIEHIISVADLGFLERVVVFVARWKAIETQYGISDF